MKNTLTSIFALVLGFFTVTFAAVMGLFIGLGALIARPFIRKKINAAYEEALKQQGYTQQSYTQSYGQEQNGSTSMVNMRTLRTQHRTARSSQWLEIMTKARRQICSLNPEFLEETPA